MKSRAMVLAPARGGSGWRGRLAPQAPGSIICRVEKPHCIRCRAPQDEKTLTKCSVCFRMFCEDCAAVMSGRRFCSKFCAEYFFHGGEEDL